MVSKFKPFFQKQDGFFYYLSSLSGGLQPAAGGIMKPSRHGLYSERQVSRTIMNKYSSFNTAKAKSMFDHCTFAAAPSLELFRTIGKR